MTKLFNGLQFEDEVRNIARIKYSNSIGQGSDIVNGRERDGVFWNGEFYTVIEATTDKSKAKAEKDAKKTHDLVVELRKKENMARGYVVTLHEPTPDQKDVVKKYSKTLSILSFDEFRSFLFDAQSYLANRSRKRFGSVYDHVDNNHDVPLDDFIEPTLSIIDSDAHLDVDDLVLRLRDGKKTILIADYGVGKSMLLRHLFFRMASDFRAKKHFRTPVAINLREHLGQSDPVELLERHARHNAASPQQLVAAWNAGYVDLLIDGFDELSTRGWTGDIRRLRDYRRSAHEVVRRLVKDSQASTGILITGRDAYFDSHAEMREALAAPRSVFALCRLHPFDDEQVRRFLVKKGYVGEFPDWIPTRPLLLTYLVTKGFLKITLEARLKGSYPMGAAWLSLIDMIAEREAGQTVGIDKASLRDFLGALALVARQAPDGQLSFSPQRMEEIFLSVTGASIQVDERNILLRLPGLGAAQDDNFNRSFIDFDFMNACCSIPISRFIQHPFGDYAGGRSFEALSSPLRDVGVESILTLCEQMKLTCGQIKTAIQHALSNDWSQLGYDLFECMARVCEIGDRFKFSGIEIEELDFSLEYYDGIRAEFSECLINRIILPAPDATNENIIFTNCLIGSVEGRVSILDVSENQFVKTEISSFTDEYSVNSQVLDSGLPLGLRVLVVTLRKIFKQYGSGRLESALVRGLDHRSRLLVPGVIDLLIRHGYIVQTGRKGKTTYSGTKAKRSNALRIIQSPNNSGEQIVRECSSLG